MKNNEPPKQVVYLVDDDEGLRSAMGRLLRAEGFETRTFASAADFLMFRDDVLRGCIIIDVRMPGGPSGLELHQSLLRKKETLPVIFLTGHGSIPMSVQAIKSGAFDSPRCGRRWKKKPRHGRREKNSGTWPAA
jgi:FixJ family two-component response regulator